MGKQLSEEFKRMQRLAGIQINEDLTPTSKYVDKYGLLDEREAEKYLNQYKKQDPEISPYDYFNDDEYGWSGEHNDADVENMTDEEIEKLLTLELSYYWYEDEDVLEFIGSEGKASGENSDSWTQDLVAELEMGKEDAWFGPSFDYDLIPANKYHKAKWQYDLDKDKFQSKEEHRQVLETFLEEIKNNIGGTYEINNIDTNYGSVSYEPGEYNA